MFNIIYSIYNRNAKRPTCVVDSNALQKLGTLGHARLQVKVHVTGIGTHFN